MVCFKNSEFGKIGNVLPRSTPGWTMLEGVRVVAQPVLLKVASNSLEYLLEMGLDSERNKS